MKRVRKMDLIAPSTNRGGIRGAAVRRRKRNPVDVGGASTRVSLLSHSHFFFRRKKISPGSSRPRRFDIRVRVESLSNLIRDHLDLDRGNPRNRDIDLDSRERRASFRATPSTRN